MSGQQQRVRVLGAALAVWGLGACSVTMPPKTVDFELLLLASERTNEGGALRVLVRRTNRAEYEMTEDYESIAALLASPGEEVVNAGVLFPEKFLRLQVSKEEGSMLGVYFMFSQEEDEGWRLALDEKTLNSQSQLVVCLGRNRVLAQHVHGVQGTEQEAQDFCDRAFSTSQM